MDLHDTIQRLQNQLAAGGYNTMWDLERSILAQMESEAIPMQERFAFLFQCFIQCPTLDPQIHLYYDCCSVGEFVDFVLHHIGDDFEPEPLLAALRQSTSNALITILLRAAMWNPNDPKKEAYETMIAELLTRPELSPEARKLLLEYQFIMPEVRPLRKGQKPCCFGMTHCYTPKLRRAEREATQMYRLKEWDFLEKPDYDTSLERQKVRPVFLQKNQIGMLSFEYYDENLVGRRDTCEYSARREASYMKAVAVSAFFAQFRFDRYAFGFAIAQGKRLLFNFEYSSLYGIWKLGNGSHVKSLGRDPEVLLKKAPDFWVLDEEAGKILRKDDLRKILERVVCGDNDWASITAQLEPLLYGRCRTLEWPSFDPKTPSTCPEGYTLIDSYRAKFFNSRTELYYKNSDMEFLPKYKR